MIITSEEFGQLLVVVEDDVSVDVLSGNGVGPQLLHEEDLIGELRRRTVPGRPGLLDPVCQVSDEVEEEIALGDGDDLVSDLDEEAEAFRGLEVQPLRDVLAEVLGPG